LLALIFIILCSIPAYAQETSLAYSADMYGFFQIVEGGQIFLSVYENYGDIFTSRRTLYSIDLNTMSAEKIFSVHNANSEIFVNSDSLYFQYPHSWICTNLLYGSHTWYSVPMDEKQNKRKWNFLKINLADGWLESAIEDFCENTIGFSEWVRYFQTVDGIYCIRSEGNEYDGCSELLKYSDGEYVSVLKMENARFGYGHSFFLIETKDWEENSFVQIYDVCAKRIVSVPYDSQFRPEVLIVEGMVYYTDGDIVRCHNAKTGETVTVFESEQGLKAMCYDGECLYIIEAEPGKRVIHEFSVRDNQYLRSVAAPAGTFRTDSYIVADGFVLNGYYDEEKLTVFKLDTQEVYKIPLEE